MHLFYGNKDIALKLQQKLRTGKVKVNGSQVTAHPPVPQQNLESRMSWMVKLTGLAKTIEEEDIIQAIPKPDRPRRVEMGEMKSQAHHAASALDGKPLPFCESSKLFVEVVTSVRFRVSTRVYDVVQQRINTHKSSWSRQYIRFFASPSRGFYRVLKLEGRDRESVAKAKQDLDLILTGDVMRLDGKAVLYPGLKISQESYKRLKMIEEELGVVIIRDVRSSQFRVFGAEVRQALATEALDCLIKETTSAIHFIRLDQENELRWALDGGFKALKSQLGRDKVVFDRESRSIIIQGYKSDFTNAKLIVARRQNKFSGKPLVGETDCPICLCEADEPIRTSCNHTYCGLCFVNMCQAEASGLVEFCISCKGDSGQCGKVFELAEIRNLLLSETFEDILEASFQSFVQRHPDQLRYYPTPDCSQVYRVTSKREQQLATFTCGKCLASICTACHTSHPGVTCAQYQGDSSGGLQALNKMSYLLGQSNETTLVKGKPDPLGFKIWVIAQQGFFIRWLWHIKEAKYGAFGVELPPPKSSTQGRGGRKGGLGRGATKAAGKKPATGDKPIALNSTQSVVVSLANMLPKTTYHVFVDNLFSSSDLFRSLRKHGHRHGSP
ncbi:hypothetical protein AK830_g12144 [Neonectria ditissima]|uniref:RING-type domain-containing protein n=1 Tax=Neonectria ditissima TaxID=78410 RepID=A0A0P7B136_9HYPO|nr:hypothetical protein AK830_g12144 [Neonectria ditissima]